MGQALGDGHMPARGHHVATVKNLANDYNWYKVGWQKRVNDPQGNLAQATTAVMAGELQSRAGEVKRDIAAWDQRMSGIVQLPGLSVSVEISYPSVWFIPHSELGAGGLVAGGLGAGDLNYPVVCWNFAPLHPTKMVRPRQRMLSHRGTSRGGTTRGHEADKAVHCYHCNLARYTDANPSTPANSWMQGLRARMTCLPLARLYSISAVP